MKKLRLNLQYIEGSQVLTREQLKKVLGGVANVTTAANCSVMLQCPDGPTVICTGTGTRCYMDTFCEGGTVGIKCDDTTICCSSAEG